MVRRTSDRYQYADGTYRQWYACAHWPDCRGSCSAHPDGTPMGVPADAATRQARMQAHAAFDAFWRGPTRIMARGDAYRWLEKQLGLPRDGAHIGAFTQAQCAQVLRAVGAYYGDRETP